MKQKALLAGTAWALGGAVLQINRFGFTEVCAYGQRASFISNSVKEMGKKK